MNPWDRLEHELAVAIHPAFADQLLDGVLQSDDMLGAYGMVADLASALRTAATDAELGREAETVAEMMRIRRVANARPKTYGRRSLAAVAAAAAMSTSVAWASGAPAAMQEATAKALAQIGVEVAQVRGEESPVAASVPSGSTAPAGSRDEDLAAAGTPRSVIEETEEPTAHEVPAEAETTAPAPEPEPPVVASAPPPVRPQPEPSPDPITVPLEDAVSSGAPEAPDEDPRHGRPDDAGRPEDTGKPDDPGRPDDPGQPGEPRKPDDKGKPDEEPGKPEDPVEPEPPAEEAEPGPPEDKGKPEETGKPEEAGPPEDAGREEQKAKYKQDD